MLTGGVSYHKEYTPTVSPYGLPPPSEREVIKVCRILSKRVTFAHLCAIVEKNAEVRYELFGTTNHERRHR